MVISHPGRGDDLRWLPVRLSEGRSNRDPKEEDKDSNKRKNRGQDIALGFTLSVQFIRFQNRLASPVTVTQECKDLTLSCASAEQISRSDQILRGWLGKVSLGFTSRNEYFGDLTGEDQLARRRSISGEVVYYQLEFVHGSGNYSQD